jgi:hypothetical protein
MLRWFTLTCVELVARPSSSRLESLLFGRRWCVGRSRLLSLPLRSTGTDDFRLQADGSELYLSNENGELHQIEASALKAQNAVPLSIEANKSAPTPYGAYGAGSGSKAPVYPGTGVTKGFGGKEKTG